MYTALRLDLPVLPVPDQRDRNDLLIVLDMFQVLERRVELGHIEVGDIVDVAKPVVPVLPRLADEVVSIALAEQTVGLLMLLRIIYDALDLNSHFKLFQLVSRRGCGRMQHNGTVAFCQCIERQQGQCHHKHQNPRQQPLSCFLSSHKKIPPSFGRNTAHRRGSMNASATGCHAVRGHRLGSWLCDTGFRRLCLLSAHLLVSVSRTAYD